MLQALYAGVSGLQSQQSKMEVIGNNIANVNTVGYKGSRVNFEDQLSQLVKAATSGTDGDVGGTNPSQIGLGTSLGSVNVLQTQGNLQSTGKSTDLAIQGNGFFMVSDGSTISYTRDGTFDVDDDGYLVNATSGQKVLCYPADAEGTVQTGETIDAASSLRIPVGTLTSAKQTSDVTFGGNLSTGLYGFTKNVDYTGNLNSAATSSDTVTATTTVYDENGKSYNVVAQFSNPTDTVSTTEGIAAGATRQWDVAITYPSGGTPTTVTTKLYRVGSSWTFLNSSGGSLGSSIVLDGGAGSNHGALVGGTQAAGNGNGKLFSVNLNFGQIGDTATASSATGAADGSSTVPNWTATSKVYDSLGNAHEITFKYRQMTLESTPPTGATSRWDWQAYENGVLVSDSTSTGNSPLYFGTDGKLVSGGTQTVGLTTTDGSATPMSITIDNSDLTQLASTSTLTPSSQDGFAVGTLQSFTIASDGVVTGVFSSGQSQSLGQIATASFTNPAGLQRAGGNLLTQTVNSGTAQVGIAGKSGRGSISSGYLEMSNVDLSNELTNMIITQRGFQANTKIVTAVDTLLQDVINMSR